MRISDWSSDVCSSDLTRCARGHRRLARRPARLVTKAPATRRDHPLRILHLHSSFSLGGKEARAVRLMNLMEDRAHHIILSAMPDALGARDAIAPGIRVDFPKDAPRSEEPTSEL